MNREHNSKGATHATSQLKLGDLFTELVLVEDRKGFGVR